MPEPEPDVERLFADWSRKLGRPALVPSYEHEIDLSRLVGLRGPYCAYLWRVLDSPEEREVDVVIGNNDAYRLYLNGEMAAEVDESVWWAPFNNVHRVHLKAGPNRLLLKLVKRGDEALRRRHLLELFAVHRAHRPPRALGPPRMRGCGTVPCNQCAPIWVRRGRVCARMTRDEPQDSRGEVSR